MKYQEKGFRNEYLTIDTELIDKYIDFWKICKDFNLEFGDITPTQTIEFEIRGSPMSTNATSTLLIDNDRTRVTEWRFQPGAATGFHRHEYDYVVVPRTTGRLKLIDGDGAETFAELTEGIPYFRETGVEHDVINANDYEFVFVEVEFK